MEKTAVLMYRKNSSRWALLIDVTSNDNDYILDQYEIDRFRAKAHYRKGVAPPIFNTSNLHYVTTLVEVRNSLPCIVTLIPLHQ